MRRGSREEISGHSVRRTGWTTPMRRCPIHDDALELCIDETDFAAWSAEHQAPFNHDDDRVRWRCERCIGSWLENWFLYRRTSRTPESLTKGLRIQCPHCGSLRVTHQCVPECCDAHARIDCRRGFSAAAHVVASSGPPRSERANVPEGNDGASITNVPGIPPVRSGICLEFRTCPKHRTPLELVFLELRSAPDTGASGALAWFCSDCVRSWSEASFRHHRSDFVPDGTAAVNCPACHRDSVVTSDGVHRCEICGQVIEVVVSA